MAARTAMLVTSSHSPLIEFPGKETDSYRAVLEEQARVRADVAAFDPELVVIFGVDHYGGQSMSCMPSFCVGVHATALADVGGTPGTLNVPKDIAVGAVDFARSDGVDVAVSYDMEVDHGFTQALVRLAGGIDRYPVLPLFVSCIQPPLVPFARARAFGEAIGRYIARLDASRVLVIGTGGLGHNPRSLFPPIDEVKDEWRPWHLRGRGQSQVSQQSWIDYEIEAHRVAAKFLADDSIPDHVFGLHDDWDEAFMNLFCGGDMSVYDGWDPGRVVDDAGIGAMEVLSWVAAGAAMSTATGEAPVRRFRQVCRVMGIGFGITSAGPAPIS